MEDLKKNLQKLIKYYKKEKENVLNRKTIYEEKADWSNYDMMIGR